ncbi:MAG: ABC transporter permease, partial [Clostridia bacterium]|nr:ABC transporter permease [Clostridia bacterium]
MSKYIVKRLLQSLLTIFLIVSVVFLLMRLMPTDYFFTEDELMKLTDQQRHDRLQAAGLLDNPFVQLFRFWKNLITKGDLGISRRIQTGKPVTTVIGSKFGISMQLGLISLFISLILGVTLGILQARFKDGLFDGIGTAYTIFVNAVPHLVSYSLIMIFGAKVLGLPSQYSARKVWKFMMFGQQVKFNYSTLLPILCLSMGSTASYMLWMRRYMVDELNKEYIRLAKLKGLS